MISKELLDTIEHELTCLTGLYACDNEDFIEYFRLDFTELLNKIEKEKRLHFK